jgi:DNA-directed RNA polymerase specialized sigma24 family protein
VRVAAREIWDKARNRARRTLGESSEAAELLETSVEQISRYLDRAQAAPFSANTCGLLMLAFHRALQRRAGKLRRVEAIGGSTELADMLRTPDWRGELERRLDLEKVVRNLSERSRAILALRTAGYDWQHIAKVLKIAPSTAQNSFWQDMRKAHLKMLTNDQASGARSSANGKPE